jgi:hypothetical protein
MRHCANQLINRSTAHWIAPERRDLAQGQKHKGALTGSGVGQSEPCALTGYDPPTIINEIKIDRARGIAPATHPPETGLDIMQHVQELGRAKIGCHPHCAIHKGWIGRVGPGRRSPGARYRLDTYTLRHKGRQC